MKHKFDDNQPILEAMNDLDLELLKSKILKAETDTVRAKLSLASFSQLDGDYNIYCTDAKENTITLSDGHTVDFNDECFELSKQLHGKVDELRLCETQQAKAKKRLWATIDLELKIDTDEGSWTINREYGVVEEKKDCGNPLHELIKEAIANI